MQQLLCDSQKVCSTKRKTSKDYKLHLYYIHYFIYIIPSNNKMKVEMKGTPNWLPGVEQEGEAEDRAAIKIV